MCAKLLIFLFGLVCCKFAENRFFYYYSRGYFLDIELHEIYSLHYSYHRSVHISCNSNYDLTTKQLLLFYLCYYKIGKCSIIEGEIISRTKISKKYKLKIFNFF